MILENLRQQSLRAVLDASLHLLEGETISPLIKSLLPGVFMTFCYFPLLSNYSMKVPGLPFIHGMFYFGANDIVYWTVHSEPHFPCL